MYPAQFLPRTHCPYGHEYNDENTSYLRSSTTGKMYKRCVKCAEEKNREKREKRQIIKLEKFGLLNKQTEKNLAVLKETPERTIEELLDLLDPKDKSNLSKTQKNTLHRSKTVSRIRWGLLGTHYPVHQKFFSSINQSLIRSKFPPPSDFAYTTEDFIKFILEVGLPDKEFSFPTIELIERKKGYVVGNFMWRDKAKRTQGFKERLKDGPYIAFNGKRYYEQTYQNSKEHVWTYTGDSEDRQEDLREDVVSVKKLLRNDVWEFYFGELKSNRTVEYIDSEGDLTDPFNLRLKSTKSTSDVLDQNIQFRQDMADISQGYIKICLGCGEEWRVLGDKPLIIREGTVDEFGPCEKRHVEVKNTKDKWKNATEAYRAGFRFKNAKVITRESLYGIANRGDDL